MENVRPREAPTGPAPAAGGSALRALVRTRHRRVMLARARSRQQRIADAITTFAGSLLFVYLHAAWFALWIGANLGAFGHAAVFDPYPFGLLTMIVSLEAIFLSTFVMVSQNRQAARDTIRADLDFEDNVRSEVWAVHIGRALGLDPDAIEHRVQEIVARSQAQVSGAQPPEPFDAARM